LSGTGSKKSSMTALVVWLMFAKSLAFIVSLALPLLLVRKLSQAEFGSYKQAFLVIGTAVAILPFGFGTSAFYFLPREDNPKTKNQIIFFAIFLSFIFLSFMHQNFTKTRNLNSDFQKIQIRSFRKTNCKKMI